LVLAILALAGWAAHLEVVRPAWKAAARLTPDSIKEVIMVSQVLEAGVLVGLLATLAMDIASGIGLRLGFAGPGPRRTGYHLIGRWFGHLLRGKFTHATIIDTPPLPREVLLGALVHYLIGAVLGLVYFFGLLLLGVEPTLWNALIFGIITTVFSWFYLYPAWGYGVLGADAKGFRMTYFSLYAHTIFGLGIALWTALIYT
jgi:hypothetical protein